MDRFLVWILSCLAVRLGTAPAHVSFIVRTVMCEHGFCIFMLVDFLRYGLFDYIQLGVQLGMPHKTLMIWLKNILAKVNGNQELPGEQERDFTFFCRKIFAFFCLHRSHALRVIRQHRQHLHHNMTVNDNLDWVLKEKICSSSVYPNCLLGEVPRYWTDSAGATRRLWKALPVVEPLHRWCLCHSSFSRYHHRVLVLVLTFIFSLRIFC